MRVLETDRLSLRHFNKDDAEFIIELLNEEGWKRFIGDRGVKSREDALNYIEKVRSSYPQHGFGLYAVELKESGKLIGMCGLLKRDNLEDVDVGFAVLERYQGAGYAREAAVGTLVYARDVLGLKRVVAITTEDNAASGRVLQLIGLNYVGPVSLGGETLRLYAIEF